MRIAHRSTGRTQTIMSTHISSQSEAAREAARHGDGKFGEQVHAEAPVSLAEPRPRQLDGWPESLPEPRVEATIDDAGVITTFITMDGYDGHLESRTNDEGPVDLDSFDSWDALGDDVRDQAMEWAEKKHRIIERGLRREMVKAAELAQARIVALHTGQAPKIEDHDLLTFAGTAREQAARLSRDAELSTAAVIARGVLEDHPTATYIGFTIDDGEKGDYISVADVFDADRNKLGEYDANEAESRLTDYEGYRVARFLEDLNPEPSKSHWWDFNHGYDEYTIDLAQAAAWTPGNR